MKKWLFVLFLLAVLLCICSYTFILHSAGIVDIGSVVDVERIDELLSDLYLKTGFGRFFYS